MAAVALVLAAGCAKKEATTSAGSPSPSASSSQAPMPEKIGVNLNFTDVSVASSGILRLGFDVINISKDPVLCDPAEFSLALSDGTVLQSDTSAEYKCDPDSVDPGVTGKAVMYFNLKAGYTGPIVLQMLGNDAIIGKGTTTVK